jgi:GDP-L-fucose synthase
MMRKLGKTLVTGGYGFLGRELVRQLNEYKLCDSLILPRSKHYDLRRQAMTSTLFYENVPINTVFHLAATVSGIGSIAQSPATYFYDNLQMGINLIHYANFHKVEKLIVAGSVCAYPAEAQIPMQESELWNGYPEASNGSYGIAKRTLVTMLQAYSQQFGLNSAYALLTNLYGPCDNFDPQTSHVIPALIRKMTADSDNLTVWGNGLATRDFLYVADAASALIELAQIETYTPPLNIGSGTEITIRKIVTLLSELMDYKGKIRWDTDKPNGQRRRLLSLDETNKVLNWRPTTDFKDGLYRTIQWYRDNQAGLA